MNFFCEKAFKRLNNAHGSSITPITKDFAKAKALFKANADRLPPDNTRQPQITVVRPDDLKSCIVTTDFFGFDTSNDHFGLQGHGDLSEMGDAIIGLLAAEMAKNQPTLPALGVSPKRFRPADQSRREHHRSRKNRRQHL